LQSPVIRPEQIETTALGAAYLAGLAVDYWESKEHLKTQWKKDREFIPQFSEEKIKLKTEKWQKALHRAVAWEE